MRWCGRASKTAAGSLPAGQAVGRHEDSLLTSCKGVGVRGCGSGCARCTLHTGPSSVCRGWLVSLEICISQRIVRETGGGLGRRNISVQTYPLPRHSGTNRFDIFILVLTVASKWTVNCSIRVIESET